MDKIGIANKFLDRMLRRTSGLYSGMNNLAKKLHKKQFATVYNRENHFVCIIGLKAKLIYYDPLGLPPFATDLIAFLQADTRKLHVNSVTVQHPLSFYCAFFVMQRILEEENKESLLIPFNYIHLEDNDSICIANILELVR